MRSADGGSVGRSRVAGRWIGRRDRLRFGWRRQPKAASSRTERYSATARLDVGSRSSTLATLRLRCASASIMLASTVKASPPTIPSFRQRATTVSNSLRNSPEDVCLGLVEPRASQTPPNFPISEPILALIFVSLELGRSTQLTTSVSPGGEKIWRRSCYPSTSRKR